MRFHEQLLCFGVLPEPIETCSERALRLRDAPIAVRKLVHANRQRLAQQRFGFGGSALAHQQAAQRGQCLRGPGMPWRELCSIDA